MPIRKVSGGYKWGSKGKVYPTREGAERQARAAYANGYQGMADGGRVTYASYGTPVRGEEGARQDQDTIARLTRDDRWGASFAPAGRGVLKGLEGLVELPTLIPGVEYDVDFVPDALDENIAERFQLGIKILMEQGMNVTEAVNRMGSWLNKSELFGEVFADPFTLVGVAPKTIAILARAAKESPTLATALRHGDRDYIDVYLRDVIGKPREGGGSVGAALSGRPRYEYTVLKEGEEFTGTQAELIERGVFKTGTTNPLSGKDIGDTYQPRGQPVITVLDKVELPPSESIRHQVYANASPEDKVLWNAIGDELRDLSDEIGFNRWEEISENAEKGLLGSVRKRSGFERDHIEPIDTGGQHELDNWQLLAWNRNNEKRNKQSGLDPMRLLRSDIETVKNFPFHMKRQFVEALENSDQELFNRLLDRGVDYTSQNLNLADGGRVEYHALSGIAGLGRKIFTPPTTTPKPAPKAPNRAQGTLGTMSKDKARGQILKGRYNKFIENPSKVQHPVMKDFARRIKAFGEKHGIQEAPSLNQVFKGLSQDDITKLEAFAKRGIANSDPEIQNLINEMMAFGTNFQTHVQIAGPKLGKKMQEEAAIIQIGVPLLSHTLALRAIAFEALKSGKNTAEFLSDVLGKPISKQQADELVDAAKKVGVNVSQRAGEAREASSLISKGKGLGPFVSELRRAAGDAGKTFNVGKPYKQATAQWDKLAEILSKQYSKLGQEGLNAVRYEQTNFPEMRRNFPEDFKKEASVDAYEQANAALKFSYYSNLLQSPKLSDALRAHLSEAKSALPRFNSGGPVSMADGGKVQYFAFSGVVKAAKKLANGEWELPNGQIKKLSGRAPSFYEVEVTLGDVVQTGSFDAETIAELTGKPLKTVKNMLSNNKEIHGNNVKISWPGAEPPKQRGPEAKPKPEIWIDDLAVSTKSRSSSNTIEMQKWVRKYLPSHEMRGFEGSGGLNWGQFVDKNRGDQRQMFTERARDWLEENAVKLDNLVKNADQATINHKVVVSWNAKLAGRKKRESSALDL